MGEGALTPSAAAHDFLRRMPPGRIEECLFDVVRLNKTLADDLMNTIDVPLKLGTDATNDAKFIQCEFNRDVDSYRSPFSSAYFPPLADGAQPPPRLRAMEIKANQAFNAYRQHYFTGGVSSVYFWPAEGGFGVGVFIKCDVDVALRTGEFMKGTIDCNDVVEVAESGKEAVYTLISSVQMSVNVDNLAVAGHTADRKLVRKVWRDDDDHLVNIGELIESNAARFRDHMSNVFLAQLKRVVDGLTVSGHSEAQKAIAAAFQARSGK